MDKHVKQIIEESNKNNKSQKIQGIKKKFFSIKKKTCNDDVNGVMKDFKYVDIDKIDEEKDNLENRQNKFLEFRPIFCEKEDDIQGNGLIKK